MYLLLVILSFSFTAKAGEFYTSPACWQGPRDYHRPFDPAYRGRISLDHTSLKEPREKTYSPNAAYWFQVDQPDRSSSPRQPGALRIYTEREYLLEVRFDDAMSVIDAHWINEKLVFVAPWWGRVLGSHLIIDVETEELVWKEMVHEGSIAFNQYQAGCAQEQFKNEPTCQCGHGRE